MAHGFEVYKSNGDVKLSVTDLLTRILYVRHLPKDESSSVVVAGFDATKGFAFAVNLDSPYYYKHAVTTSGTTISWTANSFASYRANSYLIVGMYK